MREDDRLSLISPVGYNASTCGYCSPSGSGERSKEKSSKSYGVWANNITAETYQQMVDRGWRRSGHYIYRPDCGYQGTCCPQIAIRIPVDAFRPRRDQRRAVSALQRLVREPETSLDVGKRFVLTTLPSHKGKYTRVWDVEREWNAAEWNEAEDVDWQMNGFVSGREEENPLELQKQFLKSIHQARSQEALAERRTKATTAKSGGTKLLSLRGPRIRRLETTLRLADCTTEKYQLFRSYQMKVHGESESKVSNRQGFERFLCKGPLMPFLPAYSSSGEEVTSIAGEKVEIESEAPIAFDLYHLEYRYQGRLVAVGVLDILPRSISSVYLFYDPEYASLQLGKVSVIREVALVKQIQRKRGMQGVQYYNLGLYIHTCRKMRYKAAYHPAQLLDPQSCEWLPYDSIKAQLDRGVRYNFLQHPTIPPVPERILPSTRSSDGQKGMEDVDDEVDEDLPLPPPPGILDPTALPLDMLAQCLFFDRGRINLLAKTNIVKDPKQLLKVSECIAALGPLHNRFCLYL